MDEKENSQKVLIIQGFFLFSEHDIIMAYFT